MNSEIKFLFSLNGEYSPKYKEIYEKIKREILSGVLKPLDILPSIRQASKELSVSKTSIISAYTQLVTEGYIENIDRVGYRVLSIKDISSKRENENFELLFKEKNIEYINNGIDKNSFRRSVWKKYVSSVILDENVDLTSSGDEQGEYELRYAVCNFVRKHRGVLADYEQVVISSGVQDLIALIIRIFRDEYNTVCLEKPGYAKTRYVFEDYKYNILDIDILNKGKFSKQIPNKSIIYTSPSYQYPLGEVLSIDKRYELINFAKNTNSLTIEDDYASIIRYDGMPIQSLQGLDIYDNTIYLGSFSKTFLPSLRISFMIIPKKYTKKYFDIKHKYTHTVSKVSQLALARFIEDGEMEKHLRKINKIYKNKNQIILSYIKSKYKNRLFVVNSDSGFHMVLKCYTKEVDLQAFDDEFLLINVISHKNDELIFSFSYSSIDDLELTDTLDTVVRLLRI